MVSNSRLESFENRRSGHRTVEHSGDLAIDAWGSDQVTCWREVLLALVGSFARIPATATRTRCALAISVRSPDEVLVTLLDEAIYLIDVRFELPVRAELALGGDGTVSGSFEVVPADEVELVGPLPKGVAYHGLEMCEEEGLWRCHVLIDR